MKSASDSTGEIQCNWWGEDELAPVPYYQYTNYPTRPEYVREYAKNLIMPLKDHLNDGCIGQIAEIFDGNEPNISRGTYAQAWSVGEILRAYTEDVINIK